jgi:hypothetical protein
MDEDPSTAITLIWPEAAELYNGLKAVMINRLYE